MQRCLALATIHQSFATPNPSVGAVLVYENRIIGEGFTSAFGGNHAEVNCIHNVSEADKNLIHRSTLYVSLEPCAHHGKTPPCVELIVANNIPKVVIATRDTHILVNGKGIDYLQQNGIEVIEGVLENEARTQMQHFLYAHQHRMPFVALKFAQSKDGFIARQNERTPITKDATKFWIHQLRTQFQAILIGSNTLAIDNPKLTVRYAYGKSPLRLLMCNAIEFDKQLHFFDDNHYRIITTNKLDESLKSITVNNIYDIYEVLKTLYQHNITSILVEGGSTILEAFIKADAWNEIYVLQNEKLLNSGIAAPKINLADAVVSEINQDKLYKITK